MANAHLQEYDAFAPTHGAGGCCGCEASTAPAQAFQSGSAHKVRVFKQPVGAQIGGADRPVSVAPSSRQDDRWLLCQFNPACPD